MKFDHEDQLKSGDNTVTLGVLGASHCNPKSSTGNITVPPYMPDPSSRDIVANKASHPASTIRDDLSPSPQSIIPLPWDAAKVRRQVKEPLPPGLPPGIALDGVAFEPSPSSKAHSRNVTSRSSRSREVSTDVIFSPRSAHRCNAHLGGVSAKQPLSQLVHSKLGRAPAMNTRCSGSSWSSASSFLPSNPRSNESRAYEIEQRADWVVESVFRV